MSDDELTSLDVEQAILTGKIEKRLTRDPRGVRYEVVGRALDGRSVAVVCRIPTAEWLRIITVYDRDREIMKQDIREYCDGAIERAVIQVPFKDLKKTIYPARQCRKCGEVYYEAAVYKRLESIAENRTKIRTSITFPLADYRMTESLGA